jgi:hypothetical protein
MGIRRRTVWTGLGLIAACLALSTGTVAPSLAREARTPRAALPPLGNLLVSRSVYTGTASTVLVGQPLPGGGHAVADGSYPGVWSNEAQDASFGVTSPILIDRNALAGASVVPLTTLSIPTSQLVTSFPSKSEMSLHLSTDGTKVSLMGYVAPVNALDVSNSNTLGHEDATNPVKLTYPRGVALIDALTLSSAVQVTPVNCYSGNNGRSAILDSAGDEIFMAGNAGNGGSPEPIAVVNNTGVQMVSPGGGPGTTVVGQQQGVPGAANGFQFGFATQLLGLPADKSGKDDNFRGITIFNNTLYVTKGSGSNGVNTVYQVGTEGTLPTLATASTTPISILPGFPATLAKAAGAQNPFGIWFADAGTLYVADEGVGNAAPNANAGLQKWVLQSGTWHKAYTLQKGLNHGVQYAVPGLPAALNPAPDGLRALTGRVNGDGTVTLWAVTSTVSAAVDQGADPNQLVTITDTLSFATAADAAAESFSVVQTARFGEVLRGVEFVPLAPTLYATNLLQAALLAAQALPGSDFKNHGEQQSLVSVLTGLVADLQNGGAGHGVENRIEDVIRKAGKISDPAARSGILAQLNAALSVFSEE